MPKELHEISKFMAGTVTVPSETDISDDTASYSLNIDPVAEDGILKGIPDDKTLQTDGSFGTGSDAPVNATTIASINDDGTYRAVYFDDADDKIKKIDDLQGGTAFLISDSISLITRANPAVVTTTAHPFTTGQVVFIDGVVGMTQVNDTFFTITSVDANRFSLGVDSSAYNAYGSGGTVYGASPVSTEAESKTGIPVMQVNNKEVHIGMGKGAGNKPLWCGMIPHGQFGAAAPSDLQLENAELVSPSSFTNLTKVFCNTAETKIYGYLIDTAILYRFDIALSTMDMRSAAGLFTYAGSERNIYSACKVDGEDMIWVVTAGASNQVIHKVDMDNFEIVFSCQTNLANGTKAVDVIHINADNGDQDFIWFSTGSSIYRFATPSTGDTPSPAEKKPDLIFEPDGLSSNHLDVGAFIYHNGVAWTGATVILDFKGGSGENSLFKPSNIDSSSANAWVGWLGQIKESDPTNKAIYFVHDGSCSHTSAGDCAHRVKVLSSGNTHGLIVGIMMKDTFSNGNVLNSDSAAMSSDAGGLVTIDTTEEHNVLGISGTNDDVFVISIDNSTKSDLKSATVPSVAAVANGAAIALNAGASDDLDLNNACGICIKETSTEKFHLFSGTTNARWAYGTYAAPEAKLEGEVAIALADVGSGGTLVNGTEYKYKASFVYDGYQESPLTPGVLANLTPGGSNHSHTVTTTLRNAGNYRKRITHVNIYASAGTGFYRLVKSIDITNSWEETADTSTKPAWGSYYEKVITDDGSHRESYEAINGISEVVRDTLPYYGLSTQLNSQHFIADCRHPNFEDANLILFKSQPLNFDQFDWSEDLLRLPTKPTALASFNGRIYAFGENNTYRIEPNSLFIEDTFEGVGCIGPEAVAVTEYGMCFADFNNIYLHNGNQPVAIGDSILRGDTSSWQNRDTTWTAKVKFDSKRNSFVVFLKVGSDNLAWAYNLYRKRWDLWEAFANYAPLGSLTGKNGELLVSDGRNLHHYLGGTGNRNWSWTSKKLTMGQDTQTKKFRRFRTTGSPSGSLGTNTYVKIDGSNVVESGSNAEFKVDNQAGKHVQWFFSAQSGNIDSVGTIFRRRPIK